ncbi:MAG: hypothetical protein HYX26_09715 [Acidobacteriales bacterium]|nr:hypothetical protein [Terriglobales bacterium]
MSSGFSIPGAGFDLWFKEHQGLRLEFRDQIFPGGGTDHVLGFRIGYTFR